VTQHRLNRQTLARLMVYRRLLEQLRASETDYVFSHALGGPLGVTAAQVRRDVMELGYLGNPAKGYRVIDLLDRMAAVLDAAESQAAVLVGAGRLGSALVSYFTNWSPKLKIVGVFDTDPAKIGTEVYGHACRKLSDLPRVIKRNKVDVGIIAVPADAAAVVKTMVDAGVRGVLNFAPVQLNVPDEVYVEQVDLTVSIERVAYMARSGSAAALPGGSDPGNPGSDDVASSR
jgi:redox-sensing transcriptional repressor